ncbi:hypothetical protein DPV90_07850 [Aggregatibacter aphrophilus]|nr:hypothetical protein DPV90_07850 [Aggregatibacter aphrophilus]
MPERLGIFRKILLCLSLAVASSLMAHVSRRVPYLLFLARVGRRALSIRCVLCYFLAQARK